MASRVLVLVGTKKGGFILESDAGRREWQVRGPLCGGWPIYHFSFDPAGRTLYAGGGDEWYGAAVWRSDDLGETWSHSSEGLSYGAGGPNIKAIWSVAAAHGRVYAGVEPAGLFASRDRGENWRQVSGLREHPSQPTWMGGGGGLCLHSIAPHPADPQRLWVGISAVGTFYTEDGGATWTARNRGVRADFLPDPTVETGHCVHNLQLSSNGADHLYQQNHRGFYRSADGGATWQEITAGLPSEFGFPMAVHPRQAKTIFALPLNGGEAGRYMPEGASGRLAQPRRRRPLGAAEQRPAANERLLRRAPPGPGHRPPGPGRGLLRDQRRPLLRQPRRGRVLAGGRHLPAADLVGRGDGDRRLVRITDDRPPMTRAVVRGLDRRAGMTTVYLPASLTGLFPGAARKVEVQAGTVREAIDGLNGRWPGMRDRLCSSEPAIRRHINVFVDGEKAILATALRPDTVVQIIPAVSGG